MPKPRSQPTWNPDASIAWKVEWSRAGFRDILADPERYHKYMVDKAQDFLAQDEPEQRRRLWPHGGPV